ncbi:hypothetical protein CDAR_294771 [Caerostris darwini]|uniref:Uncharacterized protein n=1 Tax=Caerostris darwini TaxID=1538125 RepID=A0AAV4UKF1_9ARAC|nr:hypothetical protein CDAR_294771 [Caerostris darwini]
MFVSIFLSAEGSNHVKTVQMNAVGLKYARKLFFTALFLGFNARLLISFFAFQRLRKNGEFLRQSRLPISRAIGSRSGRQIYDCTNEALTPPPDETPCLESPAPAKQGLESTAEPSHKKTIGDDSRTKTSLLASRVSFEGQSPVAALNNGIIICC